jgi:hypothetical protein
VRRIRAIAATTPGRYRLWSVVTAALLLASALASWAAATALGSGTDRIRNNAGPVLVATQQLVSSLAEADAAATAAFLSRPEDRESRTLYEQALARASAQVEDVSALIGDDPATHASLKDLSAAVIRYAGLVEAARATSLNGVAAPVPANYLVDALNLLGTTVADDATRLTEATQRRFERDESSRGTGVLPAVAVALVALGVLVYAQLWVYRQSRRLVNVPLALATLLLAGGTGWLVVATVGSGADITTARADGYDSITLTSRIQAAAYRAKADETVNLITGDPARRASATATAQALLGGRATDAAVEAVRQGDAPGLPGLLTDAAGEADSDRERAAVAEMFVRWQRYQDTAAQLRAVTNADQQRAVFVGPVSATFNGFNFSVESVLSDNRDQFLEGLASAGDRLGNLTLAALLAPLLAALGALFGFQLRLKEYP